MSDGDSAHGGGNDGIHLHVGEFGFHFFDQRLAQPGRRTRVLQQVSALEKPVTVQSRTQLKVPVHQRPGLFKQIQHFFLSHCISPGLQKRESRMREIPYCHPTSHFLDPTARIPYFIFRLS
jgi:hypothetical protein